jgi:hypothetical protein
VAVPDLEAIVSHYTRLIELLANDPKNEIARANYDWIMLEMYDQTVRNYGGGKMAHYLFQEKILNEEFVYERIGEEGKQLRKMFRESTKVVAAADKRQPRKSAIRTAKDKLKKFLLRKLHVDEQAAAIGDFRLKGEIHQWMYDRVSLGRLLSGMGGKNVQVRDAFTSGVPGWSEYHLDVVGSGIRKPDSLFMEATK